MATPAQLATLWKDGTARERMDILRGRDVDALVLYWHDQVRVVSMLYSTRKEPDAVYGVVGNPADTGTHITTVMLRQPNLTENTLQVVLANDVDVPIGAALRNPIVANLWQLLELLLGQFQNFSHWSQAMA